MVHWTPVIIYTLFIFIITPFLPKAIRFASTYWPGESVAYFVLGVEVIIAILLMILSGWLFIFHRPKFLRFLSGSGSILTAAFAIYQFLPNLYEFTHLPEYAVLGFLMIRTLRGKTERPYLYAFFYTTLIGSVDELYQGFLPSRSLIWYDVILNAMGGVLGLLIFWGFEKDSTGSCEDAKMDRK